MSRRNRVRSAALLLLVGASPVRSTPPPAEVLVSRQLARSRGLEVGDLVSLSADPAGREATPFWVAGIYEPTADPMQLGSPRLEVRLHLPDLMALTTDASDPQAAEAVTAVNVGLREPDDADRVASEIVARVPGIVVRPTSTSSSADTPFAVLRRFHFAIAVVTVLGATAFLFSLMVMRAEERREIAGILRLLGLPRRRILLEVVLEGLLIAAAGGLFGVLFASAIEGFVNRFFQWRYDTTLVFVRVTGPIALHSVLFAAPLGVLAGVAASWTLLRREIRALLRR